MKRATLLLAAGLCASLAQAGGDGPCTPDSAFSMQSRPDPSAVAINGSVALIARETGDIDIYDISGDTLDTVTTITSAEAREMKFFGDFAVVSYASGDTIDIYDLSDPTTPMLTHTINAPGAVQDVDFTESRLYAACGPAGVGVYDMSTPASPALLGVAAIASDSVVADQDMAVLNSGTFDLSDPTNPVQAGALNLSNGFLFGPHFLNFFGGFQVWYDLSGQDLDVSGSKNIFNGAPARDGLHIWNTSAYVADQSPTITSLEVRTYNRTTTSSSIYLYEQLRSGLPGDTRLGPSGDEVVAAERNNMWLIRQGEGKLDYVPNKFVNVLLKGDSMLVMGSGGINRYDISDPQHPTRTGTYITPANMNVGHLQLGDGFALWGVHENDGFANPSEAILLNLDTLTRISAPLFYGDGDSGATAVYGRRFLAQSDFDADYYELNSKDEVVPLGEAAAVDFSHVLSMFENSLISLSYTGTLRVYDLSDPSNIVQTGSLSSAADSFNQQATLVSATTAAVTNGDGQLLFFDLSDPGNMTEVGSISIGDDIGSLYFSDGLLSVAYTDEQAETSGLAMVDASDPSAPMIIEDVSVGGLFSPQASHDAGRRVIFDTDSLAVFNACATTMCAADLTGDGALDFNDVSGFIAAFLAQDPAADFNADGAFNFFDVSSFIIAYSAGCP